jgi:hypothetical protein
MHENQRRSRATAVLNPELDAIRLNKSHGAEYSHMHSWHLEPGRDGPTLIHILIFNQPNN